MLQSFLYSVQSGVASGHCLIDAPAFCSSQWRGPRSRDLCCCLSLRSPLLCMFPWVLVCYVASHERRASVSSSSCLFQHLAQVLTWSWLCSIKSSRLALCLFPLVFVNAQSVQYRDTWDLTDMFPPRSSSFLFFSCQDNQSMCGSDSSLSPLPWIIPLLLRYRAWWES